MSRRQPRTKPPTSTDRYKWFKQKANYTSASNKWIVVVGCGIVTSTGATLQISIADATGDAIDTQNIVSGTAVGFGEQTLRRRMLCPGGGTIGSSGAIFLSLIECQTLDDALAIL